MAVFLHFYLFRSLFYPL
uniref:Uncharacterized protein n=1 Tax=Rhizophora mucronata TaxID=61149 RepID=A0A2P2MFJ3_RHIMU